MQLTQNMRTQFETDGFIVIDDVLGKEEANKIRDMSRQFVINNGIVLDGGYCQPDALSKIPALADQLFNENFMQALRYFCGQDTVYAHHSDIQLNRYTGWHKDSRGTDDYSKDSLGNSYSIYKVAIYLQDHSNDSTALAVTKGSHLNPQIDKSGSYLQPKLGSIIIFDQRISHNGVAALIPSKIVLRMFKNAKFQKSWWDIERKIRGLQDKLFIQIAFGKNDQFTKQHSQVAIQRQLEQNGDTFYQIPEQLQAKFKSLSLNSYPTDELITVRGS